MYLSRIYIKNYRNFEEFDLFISNGEPLTIIGGNNSGKSNLLKAIRLVIDSNISPWEKRLNENDFFWHNEVNPWENGEEIVITLTFSDLQNKEEVSSFLYFLAPSEFNIENNGDALDANISFIYAPSMYNASPYNLNDDYIGFSLAGKYHPSGYYYSNDGIKIEYDDTILDLYGCKNREEFYKYFYLSQEDIVNIKEKGNDKFEKNIRQLYTNKIKKHINLLFLDAVRDVKNDFYSGYNSLVSQLIRYSVQNNKKSKIAKEITDAFKGLRSGTTIPETIKIIEDIETRLQDEKINFLTDKGNINIGTPIISLDNIGKYFNFLINLEEDLKSDLEMNIAGLGYQNLAYISAIFALFELKKEIFINDSDEKIKIVYNLLLIEEPEAHLDVQNQKFLHTQIEKKTEKLSNIKETLSPDNQEQTKCFALTQVIQTSHSTHLTSKADLKNVVVMQKNNKKTGAVNIDYLLKQNPESYMHKRRILKQYLDATRSSLLFAKKVILVEGLSEKYTLGTILNAYLKTIGGKYKNIDIDSEGIEIVEVGGKNFKPFISLYSDVGIKNKCLSFKDGDCQLQTDVDINKFSDIYKTLNNVSENQYLNIKSNIFTFEVDTFFIPNPDDLSINNIEYLKLILYKFKKEGGYFREDKTFINKMRIIDDIALSVNKQKLNREKIESFFKEIFNYEVSKPAMSLYLSSLLKAKLLQDLDEIDSWKNNLDDNEFSIKQLDDLPNFIIPKYINDGLLWLITEKN